MSQETDNSLKMMASGTLWVFIGMMLASLFEFINRWIVIRNFTLAEYGLYSLGMAIVTILVVIAALGISETIPQAIANFLGIKDSGRTKGIIKTAIKIVAITATAITFILAILSKYISEQIFHSAELLPVIRIMALAIPLLTLNDLLIGIFRGFNDTKPRVFLRDLLLNVSRTLIFLIIIAAGAGFSGIIYGFLISAAISTAAIIIYAIRKMPKIREKTRISKRWLLAFSLPVMGQNIMWFIMGWTDTLFLGYYKTAETVGLYNGAVTISRLLPLFLGAAVFLYVPIATSLYAKNLKEDVRKTYATITKWVFSATLPLLMVVLLFPGTILQAMFGTSYTGAETALRILALGYLTHTLLGPNAATILVTGRTKLLMLCAAAGIATNIILNILLVPTYGIVGAAIATAASLTLINVINSIIIYALLKAQPFTKNYIKPIIASTILAILTGIAIKEMLATRQLWLLITAFAMFTAIYGASIILTKSFDREDIMILLEIEKKTGINMEPIKRVVRRFV